MAFPLIPVLIGVGVVVVAGAAGKKKRKPLSKPQYRWETDNIVVPLNPSAVLQADKWLETPLVIVTVGPAVTPQMLHNYSEAVSEIAAANLDMTFFYAPDWNIVRQALRRIAPGASINMSKVFIISGFRTWRDMFKKELLTGATLEDFEETIIEATQYAHG